MNKIKASFLVGLGLIVVGGGYYYSVKFQTSKDSVPTQTSTTESIPEKDEACAEGLSGFSFLRKSKILSDSNIDFFIGSSDARGMIIHNTCSPLIGPFHGASSEGLVELKGDSTSAKEQLPWGCGEQAVGALFSTGSSTEIAPFLIHGKIDGVSMKWTKALKQDVKDNCKTLGDQYGVGRRDVYSIEGISGHILLERFNRKDQSACLKDTSVSRVSVVKEAGSCDEWVRSEFDCDGQPSDQNLSFEGLLGLLEIRKGSAEEKWLIFETPGYEGDGMSAFPWKSDQKIHSDEAEFLVYSGC